MKLPDGRTVWRRTHNRNIAGRSAAGVGGLVAVVVGLSVLGYGGSGDPESDHSASTHSPLLNPVVPTTIWSSPPSIAVSIPTTTVQRGGSQPGPYWRGAWLMNYWEDEGDCAVGVNDPYWVVQPGTDGMYALKTGCFPARWTAEINNTCRNHHRSARECAVWDPEEIMSQYKKHGNLLVVGLTQACLDRAHLNTYSQGALHKDCVFVPR